MPSKLIRYQNVHLDNSHNLTYRENFEKCRADIKATHPGLLPDDVAIIADLMVRYDEDVVNIDGVYYIEGDKL